MDGSPESGGGLKAHNRREISIFQKRILILGGLPDQLQNPDVLRRTGNPGFYSIIFSSLKTARVISFRQLPNVPLLNWRSCSSRVVKK